jgi:hypothetical protein
MSDPWNRCDECGRFIPLRDFADDKATRRLIAPESLYTHETWETLCRDHSGLVAADRADEVKP